MGRLMKNTGGATAPGLYDTEIRAALKARLREIHVHDSGTVILDELGLRRRQVRADVAVVNGVLHGYEIKSERDSLRRLPVQAELYGQVFDRATLVVSERHVDEATLLLPDWWEIVVVHRERDIAEFGVLREGRVNRAPCARTLVELIWRDDAIRMLEARGTARGYRARPRRVIWDRLCDVYTIGEIGAEVRALLKARAAPSAAVPSA